MFRSLVEGERGPLCGGDVGVLVGTDGLDEPTVCRAPLAHESRSALATDAVDLVLLNRTPTERAFRVVAQGTRAYEENRVGRVESEAYVLGRYGDYRYVNKFLISAVAFDCTRPRKSV